MKKEVKLEINKIKKNKNIILDVIKKIIGALLILIGLTGIILPILPGWIFIILGLGLITNKHLKELIEETKKQWKNFKQRFKNQKK